MQQNYSGVDANLLAELRPGERVLWWGRPVAKRRVLHKRTNGLGTRIGMTSVLAVVVILADGFTALNWAYVDSTAFFFLALGNGLLLFAALSLWFLGTRGRTHLRDLRYTIYAITDQRALLITAVPGQSRGVVSYGKGDISTISRHEGKDGWGDLIFGTPRMLILGGRRVMASASFGGIPRVREVEAIMFQTFKLEEKVAPPPALGEQVSQ